MEWNFVVNFLVFFEADMGIFLFSIVCLCTTIVWEKSNVLDTFFMLDKDVLFNSYHMLFMTDCSQLITHCTLPNY